MFDIAEFQIVRAWAMATIARVENRRRDETGAADLLTMVVVAAILVAAAIAITTMLVNKFKTKAESIPTG